MLDTTSAADREPKYLPDFKRFKNSKLKGFPRSPSPFPYCSASAAASAAASFIQISLNQYLNHCLFSDFFSLLCKTS